MSKSPARDIVADGLPTFADCWKPATLTYKLGRPLWVPPRIVGTPSRADRLKEADKIIGALRNAGYAITKTEEVKLT